MVKEKITHTLLFRVCTFFYVKAIFSCFVFLLLSVSTGFSENQISVRDQSTQPHKDSIYIIPDCSTAALKFGVLIKPDHYTPFPLSEKFSGPIHPWDDYHLTNPHANMSTVVRIVVDEFKCFSGIKHIVHGLERSIDGYTKRFLLTGELNLDPENTRPVNYIEKVNFEAQIYKPPAIKRAAYQKGFKSILTLFEVNKLTWKMSFNPNQPELFFKLGIGESFTIYASADRDIKTGIMITLPLL